MQIALYVVCVAFIFINGRNDGAPLVSIPIQTRRDTWWYPIFLMWLAIPVVPMLGFWRVAESLQSMMGFSPDRYADVLAIILAVLITIGVSTLLGIPTSITLALVGALTGATLASGNEVNWALVARVLTLGLAAPFVAAFISFLLWMMPLQIRRGSSSHKALQVYRGLTFPALVIAYAANDGQKILFAVALMMGSGVGAAASTGWALFLAASVFILGALSGLRTSGRFVRHGITSITPLALLWTETATAITVIGGSVAGIPLSMTQSITGGLLGTGVARSARSIYWRSIQRVGIAWLWTLPAAGILSYGMTLFFV